MTPPREAAADCRCSTALILKSRPHRQSGNPKLYRLGLRYEMPCEQAHWCALQDLLARGRACVVAAMARKDRAQWARRSRAASRWWIACRMGA